MANVQPKEVLIAVITGVHLTVYARQIVARHSEVFFATVVDIVMRATDARATAGAHQKILKTVRMALLRLAVCAVQVVDIAMLVLYAELVMSVFPVLRRESAATEATAMRDLFAEVTDNVVLRNHKHLLHRQI